MHQFSARMCLEMFNKNRLIPRGICRFATEPPNIIEVRRFETRVCYTYFPPVSPYPNYLLY